MRKIQTEKAPAAIGPYSQAVEANGFLFVSGQIPVDPKTGEIVTGGIGAQTERICQNIAAILEAAGTGMENVVKTTCYLADIGDFAAFNAVYARFFTGAPARACFAVKALPKGALAEVECIARK